jgi:hypothetical protein
VVKVVAREMNRVGKYLLVLLLVWLPNLLVNLYQELNGEDSSSRYDVVIEVMVFLTSLQGFLNAVVYAWGHTSFNRSASQIPIRQHLQIPVLMPTLLFSYPFIATDLCETTCAACPRQLAAPVCETCAR